ncbi:MAG: SCO family protein [Pseudomonadales bacterium]
MALALTAGAAAASAATAAAGFDRDQALAVSQAAIGRTLGDAVLIDRQGGTRRLSDYLGKPVVVSLIFTSCAHICPATTQQLRRGVQVARQVLGADSFQVLTIGFDTDRDTPAMMADYARRQGVQEPGWDFLAADAATIDRLAAELGFQFRSTGGGFDHLIQSTIVDGNGTVYRQVYGIDFQIPHFVEPLKTLVFALEPDQSLLAELTARIRLFCTVYDPASDSYRFSYSIFVGLAVGTLMGALALYLLVGEWRRHHRLQRPAASA